MPLSPSLLKHNLGVVRVKVHVHASIAVMNVTDLSSTGGVDWSPGEERKTFLLEARGADTKRIWVSDGEIFEGSAEGVVHILATWLVKLSLGGNSCDLRARAIPLWKPGARSGVATGHWIDILMELGRLVRIGKGEEAQVGDLEIAEER